MFMPSRKQSPLASPALLAAALTCLVPLFALAAQTAPPGAGSPPAARAARPQPDARTSEIGLARAIGATPTQILLLFLSEAALLSTLGGALGLGLGIGLAQLLHLYVPALPVKTPMEFVFLALAVSLVVGLVSGLLPARRAASLDPLVALTAE